MQIPNLSQWGLKIEEKGQMFIGPITNLPMWTDGGRFYHKTGSAPASGGRAHYFGM